MRVECFSNVKLLAASDFFFLLSSLLHLVVQLLCPFSSMIILSYRQGGSYGSLYTFCEYAAQILVLSP